MSFSMVFITTFLVLNFIHGLLLKSLKNLKTLKNRKSVVRRTGIARPAGSNRIGVSPFLPEDERRSILRNVVMF
jgi:hypothetical protein